MFFFFGSPPVGLIKEREISPRPCRVIGFVKFRLGGEAPLGRDIRSRISGFFPSRQQLPPPPYSSRRPPSLAFSTFNTLWNCSLSLPPDLPHLEVARGPSRFCSGTRSLYYYHHYIETVLFYIYIYNFCTYTYIHCSLRNEPHKGGAQFLSPFLPSRECFFNVRAVIQNWKRLFPFSLDVLIY